MLNVLFKKYSDPAAFDEKIIETIISSGVMAILWVPLFFGLMKFFARLSARVTEKKIDSD